MPGEESAVAVVPAPPLVLQGELPGVGQPALLMDVADQAVGEYGLFAGLPDGHLIAYVTPDMLAPGGEGEVEGKGVVRGGAEKKPTEETKIYPAALMR